MKNNIRRFLFYFFITVLLVVWLFPLLFIVLTSIKSPDEFYTKQMLSLPSSIFWQNFYLAWTRANLQKYIANGLLVSIIKVPLGILVEALAAFALSRLDIDKNNRIFMFFLVGMMIPMQVTLVGINYAYSRLGLVNTYHGLIYVYIGFGIPFGILVLRGFFRTIPVELDESARIDGCSNFTLFWRILLPVAKPAVASLIILDSLSTWNEFLIASILMTNDNMRTIPAGLLNFFGEFGTDYSLLSAGVIISIIPVLLIYFLFQKYFVEGMSGAVKG
ncbi:carbohydrate ABC transporter permease [Marispirochaeta aestuarii]|uniref:carbohydrate ABC transporter permease n=1 Tax=Marispirochaeta aestuarii TaxID=1963862 RepID=UPI0029C8A10E|nr:carbohydrate ABC transporter permease [Marispirochaeta aestuarii]